MSSDSKPTSAEPEATNNLAKSFEGRLSFPTDSKLKPTAPDFVTTTSSSKFSWADDAETPIDESAKKSILSEDTAESSAANESRKEMAQLDGATEFLNGSQGLDEPEFNVNVKLADLQEDPNNPLYSVTAFSDLNL